MLKKTTLITPLLLLLSLQAAELEKNSDGTEFVAPRLAGDSLAIKQLDKEDSSQANSIEEMFKKGKIKGLIRYSAQHRDTSYNAIRAGVAPQGNKKQQYSALGGYLGFQTASFYNVSLGATFYTAFPVGNNPDSRTGLGGLNEEGGSADAYTVLGESYLKYATAQHDVRIGRREMPNYRFVSLSNIRFSPITHEGGTYETTIVPDLKLNFAVITGQKNRNSEDFIGMAKAARINKTKIIDSNSSVDSRDYDSKGYYTGADKDMFMIGGVYAQENTSLELWDYYVEDFVNTLYLYGAYNIPVDKDLTLTAAFQYAKQDNVGDAVAGGVDSWFYGLKAQATWKSGITLFTNYNQVAYNEDSYDGGTIFVRWGTPQMFNSFQVQDSELAGTKSYGIGAQFELGHMGLVPNTVIRFRYGYYDMPDNLNDIFAAQNRSETTFDLRYSFTKNDGFGIFTEMDGLSVQFRIAYDHFKTDYDFQAYKNAHPGLTFEDVTADFIDTRLYIDYLF